MLKKNTNVTKVIDAILKAKEILFTVTTIIVVLLNLWLTTKLYPLTQSISGLERQVLANETAISDIETEIKEMRKEIVSKEDLKDLKKEVSGEITYFKGKLNDIMFLLGERSR